MIICECPVNVKNNSNVLLSKKTVVLLCLRIEKRDEFQQMNQVNYAAVKFIHEKREREFWS